MTIVARMLTQEADGIPGYMAHPDAPAGRPGVLMVHHAHGVTADYKIDAYRLAQLGFNVLVPDLFNMFGIGGTDHIGMGADLQAKHGDEEFLGKIDEAWQYLIVRLQTNPSRTACIGHCMGGRLLIPFAADHPQVKAIVLYYPSVRDEPETSHRPRHAFKLAPTLKCATLVFAGGLDYIATPAIQAPLWESFRGNGQPVEWHYFSDANHGFRHPDNPGFQPHYADLAWPLVTDFLLRRLV
jgi:dienelactone hydrolase